LAFAVGAARALPKLRYRRDRGAPWRQPAAATAGAMLAFDPAGSAALRPSRARARIQLIGTCSRSPADERRAVRLRSPE